MFSFSKKYWMKTTFFFYLALIPSLAVFSFIYDDRYSSAVSNDSFLGLLVIFGLFFAFTFYFGSFEIIHFPKKRSEQLQTIFLPLLQVILLIILKQASITDFFIIEMVVLTTAFFLMLTYYMLPFTEFKAPAGPIVLILAAFACFAYTFFPALWNNFDWVGLTLIGTATVTQTVYFIKDLHKVRNLEKGFPIATLIIIGVLLLIVGAIAAPLLKGLF